ncbi:MAG: hypothetical protein SF162_16780 [bacterium]|nr:hypothetical protein [bacterium]
MIQTADMLWQLNNEYTQRLSRARAALELVGRLLEERVGGLLDDSAPESADKRAADQLFAVLGYCHERMAAMNTELREWRYRYYYENAEQKRVVQDETAIRQAITRFSKMRTHHERALKELSMLIDAVPRPNTDVTSVPLGDLWETLRAALQDLLAFSSFMQNLSA